MSDRCSSRVICRTRDEKYFRSLGYGSEYVATPTNPNPIAAPVDSNKWVEVIDEEADYGNHNELMASGDRVFLAWNGAGDEYGPAMYACDGKGVVATVEGDGDLQITVGLPNGCVSGLESAVLFIGMQWKVRAKLKLVLDEKEDKADHFHILRILNQWQRVVDKEKT